MANPLLRITKPVAKQTFSVPGPQNAGILDDYAVRKNINTVEGTIEHTPTEDNHIANKKYVDDTATGGALNWTVSQAPAVIHADNYTDTTYSASDFNHNDLSNLNAGDDYEHITDAQVAALHTAGTDTTLDSGGANEVSAAQTKTAYDHSQDNTQAHSDYLLNSEADTGVGLTLTGDNSSADTQYTAQVLYNTDDTPPAASGFPIGTLYIQYTA